MSEKNILKGVVEHRHLILAQLYRNPLDKGDEYTARAMNNRSLSLDDLCDNAVTIGKYQGDPAVLKQGAKALVEMAMYTVADGMAANFGPFVVYPKIQGSFHGMTSPWDREKNPVRIRTRTTKEARRVESLIDVVIDKMYSTDAAIETYTDTPLGSVNDCFSSGNFFTVIGTKIRIEGDDPAVGVYFVPVLNPSAAVKLPVLGVNNPSMLVGLAPEATYAEYRLRIVTQYSGKYGPDALLKEPRIIESTFTLTSV